MIEIMLKIVVELNLLSIRDTGKGFFYSRNQIFRINGFQQIIDGTYFERIQRIIVKAGDEDNFKSNAWQTP